MAPDRAAHSDDRHLKPIPSPCCVAPDLLAACAPVSCVGLLEFSVTTSPGFLPAFFGNSPKERRCRLTHERSCFVSDCDLRTLEEIGRFRAVALDDLANFHFKEDRPLMDRNLQALSDQGLLHCRTVLTSRLEKLRLITLTVPGKRLLDQERSRNNPLPESRQTVHAGIRKVAEISHDTAINGMYQAEAAKIRSSGGRVRRFVRSSSLRGSLPSVPHTAAAARPLSARLEGVEASNRLAGVSQLVTPGIAHRILQAVTCVIEFTPRPAKGGKEWQFTNAAASGGSLTTISADSRFLNHPPRRTGQRRLGSSPNARWTNRAGSTGPRATAEEWPSG